VTIIGAAGKPLPERGQMLFSGINVDARTGDVILRILVDNPQRQLLPGMYVRARVPRVPGQCADRAAAGRAAQRRWPGLCLGDRWRWQGGDPHAGGGRQRRSPVAGAHRPEGRRAVVVEGQERLQEGVVVDARDWQPVASAGAVQAGSKG
jgi:multidrug efflux system membrane fusion protein